MTRVLLIRHGETHGYFDDVGLTELGEEQCRAKGKELAAVLAPGTRVAMPHAPTARGTATAVLLREVLLAELGPDSGVEIGELVTDARFDSLQFLYGGQARESSGVAKHRIGLEGERPDWAVAFDRFDTDFGAGSKAGGPIDRWMVSTDLHFEPPQVIAYRAWAGVRAQAPGTVALASSHSALLRGFASAALGHDVGEPRNLEHVEVDLDGDRATVTFRGESADVEVPAEVPPWLDPAYLDAGHRAAHRW
ncbi:broad specificity phosphatase PhoE [Actinomycetospora succinea]|uniref:Broad specificity phosphatase PhoE n=1 Tax=Actinomycetospora succinea TaxID=663603 RepID=A0A4R6USR6_9PSEU|nr:histidine phosphatase family protein [Actinomycetospora succinea]TDQ50171.1 broad specificity phosphatase PhoE [Actinomycetospora succinea]